MKKYMFLFAILVLLLFAAACSKQKAEETAEVAEETTAEETTQTETETAQTTTDEPAQTETETAEETETTETEEETNTEETTETQANEETNTEETTTEDQETGLVDGLIEYNKCGVNNTLMYGGCKIIGDISDNKIQIGIWNAGRADVEGVYIRVELKDGTEKTKQMMETLISSPEDVSVTYFDIDLSEFADSMDKINKFYYYPIDVRDDGTYWCSNQRTGFTPLNNCKTTINWD